MAMLNDIQTEIILQRIADEGVTNEALRMDLLDHYCCYIENELERGLDFEAAYKRAFQAISPNGMQEIQVELFFLLTFKKQLNMKRVIYGFGFIAAFLISLGMMFRTLHWDGSYYLFLYGFTSLIITVFALTRNAFRYLGARPMSYNLRVFSGIVAGLLIASGNLFKIHSFPTANIQMTVGMCLFSFVFLPLFFYHLYKQSLTPGT